MLPSSLSLGLAITVLYLDRVSHYKLFLIQIFNLSCGWHRPYSSGPSGTGYKFPCIYHVMLCDDKWHQRPTRVGSTLLPFILWHCHTLRVRYCTYHPLAQGHSRSAFSIVTAQPGQGSMAGRLPISLCPMKGKGNNIVSYYIKLTLWAKVYGRDTEAVHFGAYKPRRVTRGHEGGLEVYCVALDQPDNTVNKRGANVWGVKNDDMHCKINYIACVCFYGLLLSIHTSSCSRAISSHLALCSKFYCVRNRRTCHDTFYIIDVLCALH